MIFKYRFGPGWAPVSMNRVDALLTGLVSTSILENYWMGAPIEDDITGIVSKIDR